MLPGMSTRDVPPAPVRRAHRLRTAACLVYWHGTRTAESADDFTLGSDAKIVDRQIQESFGRQGQIIADLTDDLKQPGNQAFLIVLATGLLAAGCWYLASLSETGGE